MTTVTTTQVRRIRELRQQGHSLRAIARSTGMNFSTVAKYVSDEAVAKNIKREKARYAEQKKDPAVMDRKRKYAREWARVARLEGRYV